MAIIPTVKIPADNAKGFKIVNADDPRAQEPESGIDIDTMEKDDVRDVLDAHGVKYDGRSKLADLRDLAKRAVFVDL